MSLTPRHLMPKKTSTMSARSKRLEPDHHGRFQWRWQA
jgi:hypothetical protein